MTGRSSRCIFVTKNELIPKIPYHRKAHDFHFSVRSSAGRAKMWEWYDQHCLTLFKRTKTNNNKKKTGKRSELIAEWMRSKRRIVQTYLVLARHLISYWAKKWKQGKLYWNSLLGAIKLGFHHLIASANINKWSWKTIVLSERRLIFDAHDPVSIDKLLRRSSCLQDIVSLWRASRDTTHDILFWCCLSNRVYRPGFGNGFPC